ncbi:unnamed protein product, partial [marine sediment metagenome]
NFTIENFLGVILFLPIFIYLTLVIFDGIGMFRDVFSIPDSEEKEENKEITHHHFHHKDLKR